MWNLPTMGEGATNKAGISQVKLSVDMELNAKFVGNVESNKTPDNTI